MPIGPVSFNQGAWHFCMVCEKKRKLSEMQWQRGALKCSSCFDPYPLLGQREVAIAAVLEDGKVDFQVSEKLRFPDIEDDILCI